MAHRTEAAHPRGIYRRHGYISTWRRRRRGYQRALEEAGLLVRSDYQQMGDFTIESGQTAIEELLTLSDPPSAVFACNDLMAIGAINATLNMGRRVPEDIAIVGFDNIPEATIIR